VSARTSAVRPAPDAVLADIAAYVCGDPAFSDDAYVTARYCLFDALGCGIAALDSRECLRHVAPVVPGAVLPGGVHVPGTAFELDPVQAAYAIGAMVRWLDYNDTWLAAEWGHPSDNLGAILAIAAWVDAGRRRDGYPGMTVRDVLTAMIRAYEIQGVLALENSFNRVGFDHVILVKVASAAVATAMLGGSTGQVINAVSNAWVDAGPLRTYRHAPNTGWRKSWAAGDATSRAVRFALLTCAGEMGYPSALTAPRWGLQDVMLSGRPVTLARPLDDYVMENILFKIAYPVEFHAQTAVECAVDLHRELGGRLDQVARIELHTQEAAVHIIDKTGPLDNPADRDHCLQYAVAVGLLEGGLESRHYADEFAADPRIDALRALMTVVEAPDFSRDYLDPEKRSIGNAVTVHLRDGTVATRRVEYPLGHRRRRTEGFPLVIEKLRRNIAGRLGDDCARRLAALLDDARTLEAMDLEAFLGLWRPAAD
jgi:2-methylcitrate dehydratase